MKKWRRRYLVRFISGMVGYSIMLPLSLIAVGDGRVEEPWLAALVVLLPIVPFITAMTAVIANVRSLDELQRRVHLEAVVITTLLTGGVTFTYGLLEANELLPPLPTIFIAPFMIAAWGLSTLFISRRYD